jgi:hypothetical protein
MDAGVPNMDVGIPTILQKLLAQRISAAQKKQYPFCDPSSLAIRRNGPAKQEVNAAHLASMRAQEVLDLEDVRRDCRPVALVQQAALEKSGLPCGYTYGVAVVNKKRHKRDVHFCVWVMLDCTRYVVDRLRNKTFRLDECIDNGDHCRAQFEGYLHLFKLIASNEPTPKVLSKFSLDCAVRRIGFLVGAGILSRQEAPVDLADDVNSVLDVCCDVFREHHWNASCVTFCMSHAFPNEFHSPLWESWESCKKEETDTAKREANIKEMETKNSGLKLDEFFLKSLKAYYTVIK